MGANRAADKIGKTGYTGTLSQGNKVLRVRHATRTPPASGSPIIIRP